MNKAVIEGAKEIGRTALMAIIPLLLTMLIQSQAAGHFVIDLFSLEIAGLIALVSGIDKWLHKLGEGVNGNGLTGF